MYINQKNIIAVLLVLLGVCTACNNDFQTLTPDKLSGLILYLPKTNNFDTRVTETDNSNKELLYSSLYFFAFPAGAEKGPTIISLPVEGLNNNDPLLTFQDTYRPFPIDLGRGSYFFYLVANIYDANADISTLPQTESELKQQLFQIPEGFACQISDTGLPMSASHSDFFLKNDDSTTQLPDSEPYKYDGQGGALYCNLTFLYAKITVIPTDSFGFPVKLQEVNFSKLSNQEPIIFDETNTIYGGGLDVSISPLTEGTDIPESVTFYIPERFITENTKNLQSTLSFKIGQKPITIPLGLGKDTENTIEIEPYPLPEPDSKREIVRGTHYQYFLNTLADINLTVSEWTPNIIASRLQGPVYLHVEKQEYPVDTSSKTSIWFSSNAEKVRIDSPKYTYNSGGEEITLDLYNYSVDETNDSIRVWVNEKISPTEYKNIEKEKEKYNYFHIVAGSIWKRIKVNPLTLENYLTVTPTNIPIDVSLRIASGEYSGTIPISIHTNYPTVKVSFPEDGGWSDVANTPEYYLKLIGPEPESVEINDDNPLELTTELTTGDDGIIKCYIKFAGLNSGSELWKQKKTLKIKVQGFQNINGEVINSDPVEVIVNIIPMIQNYRIHFKATNPKWCKPHVYVYDCLEFPANWNVEFEGNNLASKPIGYVDGTSGTNYVAALEYSFTGAITFKGWDFSANHDVLYKSNGDKRDFNGSYARGFYIFGYEQDTWNINKEASKLRYSFDMDFCKNYRENQSICDSCKWDSPYMHRLWPGIVMEPEGDGWYVFELTDIAVPGKALIMFADYHNKDIDHKRYPGAYKVGIPLFDYPDKEGWLLYNGDMNDRVNNQFSPTKPIEQTDKRFCNY